MDVIDLSLEDMEASGGFGKTWNHEAIIQGLQDLYADKADEDGDTVVVGLTLETIAEEFYKGTAEDLRNLKHPGPDIGRTIVGDFSKAGFSQESKADRKSPVGYQTKEDGSMLFKIELTPV